MQASASPNEKPLPRQILRRSESIKAHFAAKQAEQKNGPADPNVPPVLPGTPGAATTVDPTPGSTQPVPPTDPRENDIDYWRHRAKVAEGRLRTQKEEHQAATGGLTQQISELTEQVRTLEANVPAAPTDVSEFLTPEQVKLLGAEEAQLIVDTVMRGAQQQVAKLVEAEIKPLRAATAQRHEATQDDVKRQFLTTLTELVPNFETIDVTPEWALWLSEEDENTGLPRQDALDKHIGKADAKRAAQMFKAFEKTLPVPPVPPVAPSGSGAGPSGDPRPNPNAGLTAPTAVEIREYYKRRSTIRKGQPGYVTDQEAITFEKRMKLRARQQ